MTPCTAAAEQKGNFFIMLKAISCVLKQEGLRRGRHNTVVLLIMETFTGFPSRRDSPVITV